MILRLQERGYSCGPAALRAALYVLGHNLTESSLRRKAGTTPDGTDEKGIKRAVASYGHTAREHSFNSSKKAWAWLKKTIGTGKPVLICSDSWEHWMAVVGTLGGRVIVFDPYRQQGKRRRYSGLKIYNELELTSRWSYTEEDEQIFYCMSIHP